MHYFTVNMYQHECWGTIIYTQTQKKLTTCLKCNKIVTVQNKTNQQFLIETLAFY